MPETEHNNRSSTNMPTAIAESSHLQQVNDDNEPDIFDNRASSIMTGVTTKSKFLPPPKNDNAKDTFDKVSRLHSGNFR